MDVEFGCWKEGVERIFWVSNVGVRVRVWGLASRNFGNGAGKEMPESRCFNSCIRGTILTRDLVLAQS